MKDTDKSARRFILPALMGLAAMLVLVAGTQRAGAQQQPAAPISSSGSIPFRPITIADFGPVQTNALFPSWVGVSGDWVGYAAESVVCGHCANYTHIIYVQNVVTHSIITINTASQHDYSSSEFVLGAEKIQMSGNLLTWKQPARPNANATPGPGTPTTPLSDFVPGKYDCATCYYDLNTGQGGAVQTLTATPAATPAIDWDVQVSPGANSITVTQKSTGKIVLQAVLVRGEGFRNVALSTDKLVYQHAIGGHGVPQPIEMVWLLPADASPAFSSVWQKADGPVASGKAARSWLWGPAPLVTARESYAEGVNGQRLVQYYDKSRMEINNPGGNPNDPDYITNGLLTVEMIGGEIQMGDIGRIGASVPCTIPVAGDPRKDNPLTPDYSTLRAVATIHGDNEAVSRTGQKVDDSIDVNGKVGKDLAHAGLSKYAAYVAQTKHNVPDLFWKYLTGMQSTYGFDWTFVLGYPITEAYWTTMRVSGKDMPVLIQAYQRRVLTYVPDFPPIWRIQQGNVGQHYLEWRTSALEHLAGR